jgi:lysophospholipid acyltransferase (LPLAT)-like uncharacterized protein
MKLRHPLLIRLMASLAAPLLRSWVGTVTYRFSPECRWVHPESEHVTGRFIYAIWHEALLVPAGVKSPRPVVALISRHADGELIAQVCRWFGVRAVRGSSRRGGAAALRELIEEHARSHILVTPDGPRGPRRCVQPGAVYLASCTGLPIVPVGVGFSRAWRAPSWDRLALPWPGSTVYVVVHPPVSVPGQLNREGLTPYCKTVAAGNGPGDLASRTVGTDRSVTSVGRVHRCPALFACLTCAGSVGSRKRWARWLAVSVAVGEWCNP